LLPYNCAELALSVQSLIDPFGKLPTTPVVKEHLKQFLPEGYNLSERMVRRIVKIADEHVNGKKSENVKLMPILIEKLNEIGHLAQAEYFTAEEMRKIIREIEEKDAEERKKKEEERKKKEGIARNQRRKRKPTTQKLTKPTAKRRRATRKATDDDVVEEHEEGETNELNTPGNKLPDIPDNARFVKHVFLEHASV
jgi:hypothetical protein